MGLMAARSTQRAPRESSSGVPPLGSGLGRWRVPLLSLALLAWCAPFVLRKLLQHWSLETNTLDTGIYSNLAWNIAHGAGFYSDVLERNHLGEHFSVVIALLAPFYRLWPGAEVVLVAQGLAAALCFVPLLWLCRRIVGHWLWTLLLLVLFAMYQPFLAAWEFEFQPIILGAPLIGAAVIALHQRRWGWLAISVALLATTRESALLSIAGLGIYAGLVLGQWRAAIALGAVALAAAAVIFGVVIPTFREGEWGHYDRLGVFDHLPEKGRYVFLLGLGLGFLPLLGWRAALAAVPGIALNLSVAYEYQFSSRFHYDAQISVFLFIAAIHGAARCRAWLALLDERRRRQVAVGVMIAVLAMGAAVKGRSPVERFHRARYWPSVEQTAMRHEARRLAAKPAEVAIASDSPLGPYLAHRHRYVRLDVEAHAERRLASGDLIAFTEESTWLKQWLEQQQRAVKVREPVSGVELYRWE